MDQSSLESMEQSPVQPAAGGVARLFYIDHLRAALVILVVLHHVACVYGAIVPNFYYIEPPFTDPIAGLILLIFALFNQAWFMGALFLLAGYFTPGSFDRKGPVSFLWDRLLRLGIPLVLFYFVLSPISCIGYWLMPSSLTGITTPWTWQMYPNFFGLGPMWFLAMLLIFTLGYVVWRLLIKNRSASGNGKASTPSYRSIGIFIVALALVSYLIRVIIPIGAFVFEFPTLAYLPQYLSFFVVGAIASRRDWLRNLPNSMGGVGLVMAAVAAVALFPVVLMSILSAIENASPQLPPFGYGTWQSVVYALWDSTFAVGMVLGSVMLFRRFLNGQGRLGSLLTQHSYAVYVIHIPIVVLVGYALSGIELAVLLKFSIAAVIAVPICFAVAYIVRKIPGVSRIL